MARISAWSSNLMILAVSTAVAIAVAAFTYQPIPDVQSADRDSGVGEPAGVSPRCLEADRASVAELAAILERNGPAVAAIQERATHTLSIARRHCLYGWNDRALDNYEWLRRWLSKHG